MAINRNIPIKLEDFFAIDTGFLSIRERFNSEMRKMEEDMTKFSSELMSREANFLESITIYISNLQKKKNRVNAGL